MLNPTKVMYNVNNVFLMKNKYVINLHASLNQLD